MEKLMQKLICGSSTEKVAMEMLNQMVANVESRGGFNITNIRYEYIGDNTSTLTCDYKTLPPNYIQENVRHLNPETVKKGNKRFTGGSNDKKSKGDTPLTTGEIIEAIGKVKFYG